MRLSQFHLHTEKETPAEAEIVSHKLMLKAGMLRGTHDDVVLQPPPLPLEEIRRFVRTKANPQALCRDRQAA